MGRTRFAAALLVAALCTTQVTAQTVEFTGRTLTGNALPMECFEVHGDRLGASENSLMVEAAGQDLDLNGDGIDALQGDVDVGPVSSYRRQPDGSVVLHSKIVGDGNNTSDVGDRLGAAVALLGNTLFVASSNDHSFPGFLGADTFSLLQSGLSPAPGVLRSEGYGGAVRLMAPSRLAMGKLSDGASGLLFGRVFLFDVNPSP